MGGHCRTDLAFMYTRNKNNSSEMKKLKSAGFISPKMMKEIWTPQEKAHKNTFDKCWYYGYGCMVIPYVKKHGCGKEQRFMVGHSGSGVGASSALLCLPEADSYNKIVGATPPRGVVVGLVTNLNQVGAEHKLTLAIKIAKTFDTARNTSKQHPLPMI